MHNIELDILVTNMGYKAATARSNDLTLDEVIQRLSAHPNVEGAITIGTTAGDRLTPASDYDLVVVVCEIPASVEPYGVTHIDDRFTDLLFVTTDQLEKIDSLSHPIDGNDWLGRIIRWLVQGSIVLDRHGQLQSVQRKVRTTQLLLPPRSDGRAGWWRVNYNLAQTRRMMSSTDPIYLTTAELRIALYGPTDLLFNYFEIRNLTWSGDKDAVRYLTTHDIEYLELLRKLITEADTDRKLSLYEELARRTIAPVGDLWEHGTTALAVSPGAGGSGSASSTPSFWDDLIALPCDRCTGE